MSWVRACTKRLRKLRFSWKTPLLLASLGIAMAACSDKPGPMPPLSPPRPMMEGGRVITADLVLHARPAPVRRPGSGMM